MRLGWQLVRDEQTNQLLDTTEQWLCYLHCHEGAVSLKQGIPVDTITEL